MNNNVAKVNWPTLRIERAIMNHSQHPLALGRLLLVGSLALLCLHILSRSAQAQTYVGNYGSAAGLASVPNGGPGGRRTIPGNFGRI